MKAAPTSETIRKRMLDVRSAVARVGERGREWLGNTVSTTTLLRLLLAVALAFGLWIHVTMRNNPEEPRTLPARALDVRGRPESLVLMTPLPQVDVNVIGPLILLETARRPVVPYIDLTGRGPGKGQRVRVQADMPNGLRLVWTNPDEVVVDLEPLERKELPVVAETPAQVPYDVRVDQPTIEPAVVTVTGAQSSLAQITSVVVRPDLTGGAVDLTQTVPPVPLDRLRREVIGPGLEITPRTVRVTLPAPRVTGSKSVPVRVVVTGQPASGYRIDTFAATPAIVMVHGEAALLQPVTALETEVIDISNRQQALVQTVALKLPSGLAATPPTVQVEVGIVPIEVRTTITLAAITRGLGPGLRAQVVPGNVNVTLQGPVPRIQALDVGALRAEVNLQGLGPGTHRVRPQITGPTLDGLRVEAQPEMVTVQIAAEPTPAPTATPPPTPTRLPSPTPTRAP